MTEVAAPIGRVRPDARPPITPAQAAALQEACAAAAAIHSALELGVVARVTEALRPGGTAAIVDILPTQRGDGPRPAVLYALGLVLRTSSGRIYPHSTFRGWLGEGGFEDVRRRNVPGPFPFTLITAARR